MCVAEDQAPVSTRTVLALQEVVSGQALYILFATGFPVPSMCLLEWVLPTVYE